MFAQQAYSPLRKLLSVALAGALCVSAPVVLAFPFFVLENTETETPEPVSGGFSFGLTLPNAFDPVDMYFGFDNVLVTVQDSYADDTFDPADIASITLQGNAISRSFWREGFPGELGPGGESDGQEMNGGASATWDFYFQYSCDSGGTGCITWFPDDGFFGVNGTEAAIAGTGSGFLEYLAGPDLASTPGIDETTDCGSGDCRINLAINPDPLELIDGFAYKFFPNFPAGVPNDAVAVTLDDCPAGLEDLCSDYISGDGDDGSDIAPVAYGSAAPNPNGGMGIGPILFGDVYADEPVNSGSFVGSPSSSVAVAEPGTLALLGLSVFSFAALRIRRRSPRSVATA